MVLGGTALTGGRGGIAQTVISLLIYGTLRNDLDNITSTDVFLKDFIRGVVLMVNVLLSGRAPRDKSSETSSLQSIVDSQQTKEFS